MTNEQRNVDAEVGANLRVAREAKGISQAQLADLMQERGFDFYQQTVYKIEAGARKVTVGEAHALADALGLWSVLNLIQPTGLLTADLMTLRVRSDGEELTHSVRRYMQSQIELARNADKYLSTVANDDEPPHPEVVERFREALTTTPFWLVCEEQRRVRILTDSDNFPRDADPDERLADDLKALLVDAWSDALRVPDDEG